PRRSVVAGRGRRRPWAWQRNRTEARSPAVSPAASGSGVTVARRERWPGANGGPPPTVARRPRWPATNAGAAPAYRAVGRDLGARRRSLALRTWLRCRDPAHRRRCSVQFSLGGPESLLHFAVFFRRMTRLRVPAPPAGPFSPPWPGGLARP